jgi:hypothetical protein
VAAERVALTHLADIDMGAKFGVRRMRRRTPSFEQEIEGFESFLPSRHTKIRASLRLDHDILWFERAERCAASS